MEREVLKMLGPCVDMTKAQTTHDTDKNLFMYQVGTTLPPPHLTPDTDKNLFMYQVGKTLPPPHLTHDTDKNLFMYQVGTTLPPPHLTHDTGGYRRFTHPASLIHALLLLPATAYHSGVPTGGLPSLLAPRHPDITLLYLSS